MILKAISLWQCWASLFAAGIKKNETRGWSTSYRGWLAVHAAKHKDPYASLLYDRLCEHCEYSQFLMDAQWLPSEFENLPFGAIVGVVKIVDCVPTERIVTQLGTLERILGNYESERFAWCAKNARLFEKPIPWKGKQGFFNVEIPADYLKAA